MRPPQADLRGMQRIRGGPARPAAAQGRPALSHGDRRMVRHTSAISSERWHFAENRLCERFSRHAAQQALSEIRPDSDAGDFLIGLLRVDDHHYDNLGRRHPAGRHADQPTAHSPKSGREHPGQERSR